MSVYNHIVGTSGEDIALKFYLHKGYKLLGRNVRSRFGELDLIFECEKIIIFVEVKTRSSVNKGLPYESVHVRKLVSLRRNMLFYLLKHALQYRKCKLLVCSIVLVQEGKNILKDYEIVL